MIRCVRGGYDQSTCVQDARDQLERGNELRRRVPASGRIREHSYDVIGNGFLSATLWLRKRCGSRVAARMPQPKTASKPLA